VIPGDKEGDEKGDEGAGVPVCFGTADGVEGTPGEELE
jgi:hypothetical protein